MFKRMMILALCILLMIAGTSCVGTGTTTSTTESSPPTTTELKLESADLLAGYLFIMDYLTTEHELGGALKYLAVDTSQLVGLTDADKTNFLRALDKYHLHVMDKTIAELTSEGFISHDATREFTDGVWIGIDHVRIDGPTVTWNATIYYAGLQGWGPIDFAITFDGIRWALTHTGVTMVA
jgi:hypothetical protein